MTLKPRTATDLLRARNHDSDAEALAQPTLAEVFSKVAWDGAATAFVTGRIGACDKPILWVQDRLSRLEAGRLYLKGLPHALQVILVELSKPQDVLRAMEEGLGCTALGGVVGEVWGDAPALDFTATKRLALRSEAHGVPCWLVRRGAHPNLSAARERWWLESLPALPNPDDQRAPGAPQWRADLFRSRYRAPTDWVVQMKDGALDFDHATGARHMKAAASGGLP